MEKHQERAKELVGEIIALHPRVERTGKAFARKLAEANENLNDSSLFSSPEYWRLVAFSDGMIRVRQTIEQNFHFMHTSSILATTRYILELLIWFRLLIKDPAYGFTYVQLLLTDSLERAKEHLKKAKQEVEFFRELEKRESSEWDSQCQATNAKSAPSMHFISSEIDRVARRHFCLYAADAKMRGYGYQAFLVERQVFPKLEQEIRDIETYRARAISQMPKSARLSERWKWQWKQQAGAAGMGEQFDFLSIPTRADSCMRRHQA